MKSKLFKILGVVAVVAMLASALVAPVFANVSGVTVNVPAHPATGGDISATGDYTIYATLGTQVTGKSTGTITMPYTNDIVTITADANPAPFNTVAISVASGTIAADITFGNAGLFTLNTGSTTAGVIAFTAASQTETLTTLAPGAGVVITYTKTWGNPAITPTTDLSSLVPSYGVPTYTYPNFSLPNIGDTLVITKNADTTATVPQGATTGSYSVSAGQTLVGTTYTIATATVTITATAANTTGTWTTQAAATAALGVVNSYYLPATGDSFVITANGDTTATLPTATGTFGVSFDTGASGTGYGAGTITFGSSLHAYVTAGATVPATGTWTKVAPANATAALGTNVYATPIAITNTANGDTITITFPTGFTVGAFGALPTIAATQGWVTFPGSSTPVGSTNAALTVVPTWVPNSTALTVVATLPAGDYIGANSQMLIHITSGVTNTATAGTYTLTVATSKETTAVTSGTFAITNPIIPVVAGVASVFNSAGTQVYSSNDLGTALTNVPDKGTIKLSAGTYTGAFSAKAGDSLNITIMGTDASAANVIIQPTDAWVLSGKTVTVNMVTIDASKGGSLTVGSTTASAAATVTSSYLTGGVLTMTNSGTGATSTVYGDTFTVANGAVGLNAPVTTIVTGCTFNVAGTGTGITSANKITISGATFIGVAASSNNGVGIVLSGGTGSTVTTSIFTGLNSALVVSGAAVSFNGNTVTSCGLTAGPDAIMTTSTTGTGVFILNNKITNSLEYIVNNSANDSLVVVMDNTFSGNVKSANNTDATIAKMNVTHNSWGTGVTAPTSTAAPNWVDYSNPLGSVPTASNFVTGVAPLTLDATATAGVNVTASTGATVIGAAALTGNPVVPTIAATNTVVKYFDVFGIGDTGATIDFYGATANSITANSQIFFFNSTFGTWQACSLQTINTYGNYVEVTINNNTGSTASAPTNVQFAGLPFALVTVPTAALPGVVPPATVLSPVNGAVNVPISNLTFTWPAVAGTGVTYQFALAQASANTSAAPFAILDYSDNTTTNAEPSQETLQYNTIYWWEVRAITMNASGGIANSGPWAVQMFTTAPAPVTTTGTGTVVTNTSLVLTTTVVNTTVVQTSTNIVLPTSTGTNSPAIPSYLLWAVIAVGAVLIIAVIVLIVRTRRIP